MLKKMFVVFALVAGVSVFAEVNDHENWRKVNMASITSEQIAYMKDFSSKNKGYHSAIYALTVFYAENPNAEFTVAKMESIVKGYVNSEKGIYSPVMGYISRSGKINNAIATELLKSGKYDNEEAFKWLVVKGVINAGNVNQYRVNYIKDATDGNKIATTVNYLINDCSKLKDAEATKYLTAAYRVILPKLVDVPDLKNSATKLGLALKAYGVDVK